MVLFVGSRGAGAGQKSVTLAHPGAYLQASVLKRGSKNTSHSHQKPS